MRCGKWVCQADEDGMGMGMIHKDPESSRGLIYLDNLSRT